MNYEHKQNGEIITYRSYNRLNYTDKKNYKSTTKDIVENICSLTENQKERFKKLWWIYGNDGPKCTLLNHKLVQGFYEYNENRIDAYRDGNKNMAERFGKEYALKNGVTEECISACEEILNNP